MSQKAHIRTLAAVAVVALLVSLALVQCTVASDGGHVTSATDKSAAHADVTVVGKATGDRIGKADVYLDGILAGKTDSKGNFTFTETPAAGTHTLTVVRKGFQNATVTTNLSEKPAWVGMVPVKAGKTVTLHVTDRNTKHELANVAIYNNGYELGTTDESGNLAISDFPKGIYMPKLYADGYKPTLVFMVVFGDKTQNVAMTPLQETAHSSEH